MLNVRKLGPEDARIYKEVRLRALKENPEAFLSTYDTEKDRPIETTEKNLESSESKFTLGAFEGEKLVGIVTFVRETHPKIAHKANVYGMYVAPESRRKGVGSILLGELLGMARKCEGLERVNLTVVSDNAAAKTLYESFGFAVYGTERNAMKSEGKYQDEDMMVLVL